MSIAGLTEYVKYTPPEEGYILHTPPDILPHLPRQSKDRMRGLESNVIARDISDGFRKPIRRQEFFDGEMRKLNNPRITVLDSDQA